MKNKEYYWTMRNGEKINVDDMTESHLRNVLKLIIKRNTDSHIDNEYNKKRNKAIKEQKNLEPYCDDWLWKQFYFITYMRCSGAF